MTVDDALMQHLADLADPVVDGNLGAPQAQRRLTTHSDAMGALPAIQAPVVDVPYLVRVPACEHLVYKLIIVSLMVPRMASFEAVPVLGKDLLEDVPVLRGCCNHAGAPSWGSGIFHIPPNLVVRRITTHRKPPDVRICRLRNQSRVGTVPPSTSTPQWPAYCARRW